MATIAEKLLQATYLTEVSANGEKWDFRKAYSRIAAELLEIIDKKKSQRIRECCDYLSLAWQEAATGERSCRVSASNRCKASKLCAICAATKTNQWRRELQTVLPQIAKEHPDYRYLFLTVTVTNPAITDLRSNLRHMTKSWSRMMRRKEMRCVKGFLRATEVTIGKDGPMQAHPHFHILLLVPGEYFTSNMYLTHQQWIDLWVQSARLDYRPSVQIKAVKDTDRAVEETIKIASYSISMADALQQPEWFREYYKQTLKLQFTNAGGIIKEWLKDVENTEEQPEDLDEGNTTVAAEPTGEVDTYRYDTGRKRYVLVRRVVQGEVVWESETEKRGNPTWPGG